MRCILAILCVPLLATFAQSSDETLAVQVQLQMGVNGPPIAAGASLKQDDFEEIEEVEEFFEGEDPMAHRTGAGGRAPSDWGYDLPPAKEEAGPTQAPPAGPRKVIRRRKVRVGPNGTIPGPWMSDDDWTYMGASKWANGFPACGGRQQSPIDLKSQLLGPDEMPAQYTLARTYTPGVEHHYEHALMLNDGKMLRVNLSAGDFGGLNLGYMGMYKAMGLSFHMPSEHTVDGQGFAGEMQIIHEQKGTGKQAILSVMLEVGEATEAVSAFFDKIRHAVPGISEKGHEMLCATPIDLGAFREKLNGRYWNYIGSLSQPPCTEGVQRIVLAKPAKVDQSTFELFRRVFDGNRRAVQESPDCDVLGPKNWNKDPNADDSQSFSTFAPVVEDGNGDASAPAPAPVEEATTAAPPPMKVEIVPSIVPR